MEWYKILCKALTSGSLTSQLKTKLRKAKPTEETRGHFILWVLGELIPQTPEGTVVAALWEQRLAGNDPDKSVWDSAAEAARLAADDHKAANDGVYLSRIASKHFRGRSPLGEIPNDPAKELVLKEAYNKALASDQHMHARHAAWSAALVDRPETIRGVVMSAAATQADRDYALKQMTDKLRELMSDD